MNVVDEGSVTLTHRRAAAAENVTAWAGAGAVCRSSYRDAPFDVARYVTE